jgi:hypothetical protein
MSCKAHRDVAYKNSEERASYARSGATPEIAA